MKLKPVVLLLGLYFSAPAFAIGLGDLAVRSHLGQPLHATVEILSAPPTLAADCVSLRPSDSGLAAPAQARFRIERRGENALLHITTPKAVNDPFAQFVLISDCEGRLQREYVVLLDPPAVIAPAAVAPVRLAEPQAKTASNPASVPLASAAVPPAPGTLAKSAEPAAATASPVAAAKPAATAKPRRPAQRKVAPRATTPRLVISGKDTLPEAGSLPAGLEKQAPPPESSNTRAPELSANELSDENTALNRKLAYLEAQLAALHKRNEELEARRAAAEASAPKPVADQPPQWPLYLLGLGLLTSGGLLASRLMRRRDMPRSEVAATVLWARPNNAIATKAGVELDAPLPRLEPMLASDSLPQNPQTPAPDIEEISLTALSEGTEVKEDLLDQAEVFVAHGHANLAIHMLQQHLRQAPDESPMPWLLLLDLLRREGDEAGYATASEECQHHFNINLAAHPMAGELDDSRGLENYPHLLEMLTQAWDTPGIDALFAELIYDQRGGTRLGFEPGAYRDILLLRDIAQQKTLAMAA